jgi:hypothetical protein
MDDQLKIHMLELEIQKLRNFIFVKGLQWEFVGYMGGDTADFERASQSRNAEQPKCRWCGEVGPLRAGGYCSRSCEKDSLATQAQDATDPTKGEK